MFGILQSPFPCSFGKKENLLASFLISVFIGLFLLIFEPFGISESKLKYKELISIGFGLVTFLVQLFFYFVVPIFFKNFFVEKYFTFGKYLTATIGLLLLIGVANGIYAHFFLTGNAQVSMFNMMLQTFLIGIFPVTFLSLLHYNLLLHSNLKASEDIKLSTETRSNELRNNLDKYYKISIDNEISKIPLNDLLFIESEGNYIKVNQYLEGAHLKTKYRTTLKSIESENPHLNIVRCHRSFIVNLDQVINVGGNAQGLKLTLKNGKELIPVSRKYISLIKSYFKH